MTSEHKDQGAVASLAERAHARWASSAVGSRVCPSWSRVTWGALGMIAAHMIVRTWATSRSSFMWGDYIFIADVTRGDTGLAWLFHSHFSLLQPVGFALAWIVGGAGLDWTAYATNILVLQLLAALTCWWMLRTLFGNHRLILLPLAFYLFSPLTIPASVWWSVAIYQYPHQIAMFGAIAGHVMYLRSGRLRHLAVAVAFFVLGLGAYLKAPLILLVLLGISWLWFTDGRWRNRVRQLATSWLAWSAYAALTVGYVVLWLSRQTAPPARQNCELPGVLNHSLLDTIGTSLVGGPLNWRLWTGGIDPYIASSDCVPQAYRGNPDLLVGGAPQSLAAPVLVVVVAAWLLLVALLLHRWARHSNALKSLWIIVPYIVLSAIVVFAGRAGTWGSQVSSREIRYFSDVAVVVALGLGTALMPILGAKIAVRRRTRPWVTTPMSTAVLRGLVTVFIVGSLFSTISYVLPWHSTVRSSTFPERTFLSQLEASLSSAGEPVVRIADVPLPVVIANPMISPYNLPSRKFSALAPRLQAVQQGNDLGVLDDRGRIRAAEIPDSPRAKTGPVEGCGYLVRGEFDRIAITPVSAGPWWMRVDYFANEDGAVTINAGPMSRTIAVEQGLHQLIFLTEGDFSSVWLQAQDPDLSVCVDNIHVGPVLPKEDPS